LQYQNQTLAGKNTFQSTPCPLDSSDKGADGTVYETLKQF